MKTTNKWLKCYKPLSKLNQSVYKRLLQKTPVSLIVRNTVKGFIFMGCCKRWKKQIALSEFTATTLGHAT